MVKLISQLLINKTNFWSLIFCNEYLCVSLGIDNLIILTEYVKIPLNVEEVEVTIKAWLVDMEVYNPLFGIF